jgi:predicted nucleic acid-binding protein
VPAHWSVEVANALGRNVRRGRIPLDLLQVIQERLSKLVIVPDASVTPSDITSLVSSAADQRLTTYDACYVQLAVQSRAPLATLDRDMRAAALKLGITLLPA